MASMHGPWTLEVSFRHCDVIFHPQTMVRASIPILSMPSLITTSIVYLWDTYLLYRDCVVVWDLMYLLNRACVVVWDLMHGP